MKELQKEDGYEEMAPPPTGDAASAAPDTWWSPQFIGVAPHRLGVYQAALESGVFACVTRPEKKLAFSQVNDDYCDCEEDGSDEPGTEACASLSAPSSWRRSSLSSSAAHDAAADVDDRRLDEEVLPRRFFCRFQLPGAVSGLARADADAAAAFDYDADNLRTIPLQWTPHSRVNDGLCDCCDGSDEWRNVSTLPASAALAAPAHYGSKPGHFETSIIHFPTSEGVSEVSERANK